MEYTVKKSYKFNGSTNNLIVIIIIKFQHNTNSDITNLLSYITIYMSIVFVI